jgi:DNA-binding XRE family transcriptional regulator
MSSLLGGYITKWWESENEERKRKAEILATTGNADVTVTELSRYQLAKEIGISDMTLKRLIEDEHYAPGDDVLEALATFFHEDIHKMFDLKRGINAAARQDALDMADDAIQLSDTNRDNVDKLLMEVASRQDDDTKGIALLMLSLHQSVDQLTKEIALLRRELHK